MDFWRVTCLSAGVFGVLALTSLPAQGLVEPVELRHKLAQGETLTYTYTLSYRNWFGVFSIRRSDERLVAGQQIIKVKTVKEDGTISLEIVERLRITTREGTEDLPSRPSEVQMRPNGEIFEPPGGNAIFLLPRLPEHPLVNGESWRSGVFIGNAGLAGYLAMPRMLTLMGVEQAGEQRVARIQIRGEEARSIEGPLPAGADVAQMRLSGTVILSGEILWLVDQGRMQKFREEANLDAPLHVEYEGSKGTGQFVFKGVQQLELVPGSY